MTDNDFLEWIYARMVTVHNENELTDYMQKFKSIIKKGKMTEPDYKIQEIFEPENMRVYFCVYSLGANPQLIRRQFETLEEAKDCVKMCRKYKNRVFHYVEE